VALGDKKVATLREFVEALSDVELVAGDQVKMTVSRRSQKFLADDLVKLPSLASKLKAATNPVAIYLKGRLSDGTKEALAKYKDSDSDPVPLRKALVDDLNKIIRGPSVYDRQRFEGVRLRSETKQLLKEDPQGEALVRLNRLLLEDAYPLDIAAILTRKGKEPKEEKEITLTLCSVYEVPSRLDLLRRGRGGG
jgi:hypothetical protein